MQEIKFLLNSLVDFKDIKSSLVEECDYYGNLVTIIAEISDNSKEADACVKGLRYFCKSRDIKLEVYHV